MIQALDRIWQDSVRVKDFSRQPPQRVLYRGVKSGKTSGDGLEPSLLQITLRVLNIRRGIKKRTAEKTSTCRHHKDTAFASHECFCAQFISVKILAHSLSHFP